MNWKSVRNSLLALLAVPFIMLGAITTSQATQQIEWKTLLPELPPLVDPLAKLTQDQRFDFETIVWARSLTEDEKRIDYNVQAVEDAKRYERQFLTAGFDIDQLLVKQAEWHRKLEARQQLVNKSLHQKKIKMAGYLLPLNFSETGNTDFLLVPYVGACVHVPPPPPNQIVFVKLARKFQVKDLFTPVWVNGKMKAKRARKAIEFSDGNRDVDIGYSIESAGVEAYAE